MHVSSLDQNSLILQQMQAQGRTHRKNPEMPAGKATDSQEAVVNQSPPTSYDLNVSYEYAVRRRMEFSTRPTEGRQPETREIDEPREDQHGRRASRRTLRHATRQALRGLDREVGSTLKQFVKENHDLLDQDLRHGIKELRHGFRHDLRSALSAGFGHRRPDMGAVTQGVQQAFTNLINGLESLAAGLDRQDAVQPEPAPAPAETVPTEEIAVPERSDGSAAAVQTRGSISYSETRTAQVAASTRTNGSSFVGSATYSVATAVRVSFSASFSVMTDRSDGAGRDLFGRLGSILATFTDELAALLEGDDERELDPTAFLSGLGDALHKLADELQSLIDEDPDLAEDDTPQAVPLPPQVLPYEPFIPEGTETAERFELTA